MFYKIAIASDHAGYSLKQQIINMLSNTEHEVEDLGTYSEAKVDYPDYANKLCNSIRAGENQIGILLCSTGIGMSIAANRHSGIRAALVLSEYMASRARMHNDANILVLGTKTTADKDNLSFVQTFLATTFEGGRHIKRLSKIT